MSLNNSQGLKQRDLNNKSHVLDLSTGIKIYVGGRLHDKDKKIRSNTPFFRLNGTLLINGLIRETTEPIPIKKITQSIKQSIFIKKREERSRQ
jgi:hypothetical protein